MKNAATAFFLSMIPGLGHLYIGRFIRAFFYFGGSLVIGLLSLFLYFGMNDGGYLFVGLLGIFVIWGINILDMVVTILNKGNGVFAPKPVYHMVNGQMVEMQLPTSDPLLQVQHDERMRVMFLSIIPGLGYLSMGLIKRGMSVIIAITVIFGLSILLSNIVFGTLPNLMLLAIPVLWVYSVFDSLRLVRGKQAGALIEDELLLKDWVSTLKGETKSELALGLSLIPGLGHLVLGYSKTGFQLLMLLGAAIFLNNEMNMPFVVYFTPLIWAYSFFDTLYILRNQSQHKQEQTALSTLFTQYRRWLGVLLVVFGLYFIGDLFARNALDYFSEVWHQRYLNYRYMIPTILTTFIVIFIGIKLMTTKLASKQEKKHK